MTVKKRLFRLHIVFILLWFPFKNSSAQDIENEFETRPFLEVSFKPIKKTKITVSPELRFKDGFTLDKYLIEGGLSYKPVKFLNLGASYRFLGNKKKNNTTEYMHRFGANVSVKKDINRFSASLRVRYTNYADADSKKSDFIGYRAKLKYNIKGMKLNPFMSFEMYHDLDKKSIHKTRYTAGAEYKLAKRSFVEASYKYDYFIYEYRNRHILKLGYIYKF